MFDSRMMASFVKEARMIQTVDSDTPPGYIETRAAIESLYGVSKTASLGTLRLPNAAVKKTLPAVANTMAAKPSAMAKAVTSPKGVFAQPPPVMPQHYNKLKPQNAGFAAGTGNAIAPPKVVMPNRGVPTGHSGPTMTLSGIPTRSFIPPDAGVMHVDPFSGRAYHEANTLQKMRSAVGVRTKIATLLRKAASIGSHAAELAGLGILAKPSIDEMRGKHVDERKKAKMEVAGLGVLAAPSAHELAKSTSQTYRSALSRAGSVFKRAPTQALTHLHG